MRHVHVLKILLLYIRMYLNTCLYFSFFYSIHIYVLKILILYIRMYFNMCLYFVKNTRTCTLQSHFVNDNVLQLVTCNQRSNFSSFYTTQTLLQTVVSNIYNKYLLQYLESDSSL